MRVATTLKKEPQRPLRLVHVALAVRRQSPEGVHAGQSYKLPLQKDLVGTVAGIGTIKSKGPI